ncbi:MAG TPA: DUF104 domain-containing protein [Candidatus Altiarchaeales archaeon]|nr:MAG: antitoxin [Candidatus Wolframiiraptor sp.]HDN83555.1 DUF104 domain-containing protein [Candidatus Altiarchaeales archaeon]
MPKVIEVVYENGVFRPLGKVNLPEKTRLKIKIDDIEDLLEEFCGLLESKITLEDIKKMRCETKTWRKQ